MSKNKNIESIIYLAQCKSERRLVYVGKTHQAASTHQESLDLRIEQHKQSSKSGDAAPFHKALFEQGFENWDWKILTTCSKKSEIEEEKRQIKAWDALPVEMLNVTHAKKKKKSNFKIPENVRNKVVSIEKSELGKLFLRDKGKLKPVLNIKTNKIHDSLSKAADTESLSKSAIRNSCKTGKMLEDGTRFAYLDLNNEPLLQKGHSQEIYIHKKARRVKNLINSSIYENSKDAAKRLSVSESTINSAANGKYYTVKNKWVLCYLGNDDKELIKAKHEVGLKRLKNLDKDRYVAWHIDDLERDNLRKFKSTKEISEKLGINQSHINSVCYGDRVHVNKWRIAFLTDDMQPKLTSKHHEAPKKVLRKVICLDDNKIFKNSADAGRFYGLGGSSINNCARGNAKTTGSKRFAFLNDDMQPMLTDKHREPLRHKGKYQIVLISTGEVFNSLTAYCQKTGVSYKTAKNYMQDKSINLFGYQFYHIEMDD